MQQVPYPQDFSAHTQEFWEELILGPVEFKMGAQEEDGRRFHDMGDFDEDHDDERTADAVVGVGDAPVHEN